MKNTVARAALIGGIVFCTLFPALFLALLPTPGFADEFTDASTKLCLKLKSCAMAQVDQQNLTPEIRQVMASGLNEMCANLHSQVAAVPSGHALYDSALACMRSIEALDCSRMIDSGQVSTRACQEHEALASG